MKTKTGKTKTRISRITISRLYNCGNYENCSYSITVDVAEDGSASKAVRAIEHILIGLKPIRNVLLSDEAKRRAESNERMRSMTDEQFARQYGDPEGGRRAYYKRCVKSLKEDIAKSKAAFARAKKARDLFDDLGGAEKWKDAKLDWEEQDWE